MGAFCTVVSLLQMRAQTLPDVVVHPELDLLAIQDWQVRNPLYDCALPMVAICTCIAQLLAFQRWDSKVLLFGLAYHGSKRRYFGTPVNAGENHTNSIPHAPHAMCGTAETSNGSLLHSSALISCRRHSSPMKQVVHLVSLIR
jgi:hypothetical protein